MWIECSSCCARTESVATGSRFNSKRRCLLISKSCVDPVATVPGSDTILRPQKIRRHAQKHDSKTYRAVLRKFVNHAERYHGTRADEEKRRERMSGDAENSSVG